MATSACILSLLTSKLKRNNISIYLCPEKCVYSYILALFLCVSVLPKVASPKHTCWYFSMFFFELPQS